MTALAQFSLRRWRAAPWAVQLVVLFGAAFAIGRLCLAQPSDPDQIASLVRRSVRARDRGDVAAAYRMTDLDFRAICPPNRFAAGIAAERGSAVRVAAVADVQVQGPRASALVTLSGPEGAVQERREFVREGSRWYVYEDLARCGPGG